MSCREEDRASIEKLAESAGVELHLMSNQTEEGVNDVKTAACDKLLQARVDARMAGKKVHPWLPLNGYTGVSQDGCKKGTAISTGTCWLMQAREEGAPGS